MIGKRAITPAVTIAILAGGQSRRMQADKSFVMLNGKPIFEHVLSRVATLELPVLLITNTPAKYAQYMLTMVEDLLPEQGALGGIYTAVHESLTEYTLCVACDMPFINPELLHYLITLVADQDVVVPRIDGLPEAMHAIYRKTCLLPIHTQLEQGNLKASGFYGHVRTRFVEKAEIRTIDPDLRSFVNLNTPQDLAAYSNLAAE